MAQIILEVSDATLAAIKKQIEDREDCKVHKPLEVLKEMLELDLSNDFQCYVDYFIDYSMSGDGFQQDIDLDESIIEFED